MELYGGQKILEKECKENEEEKIIINMRKQGDK